MKITNQNLNAFRRSFEIAMKALEEKYDVNIEMGNIRYSADSFRSKIEVTNKVAGKSAEEVEFGKWCGMFGLKESDLGRQFTSNGRVFTLTGIKPSRRKYPISGVGQRGGRYKFTESVVKNLI